MRVRYVDPLLLVLIASECLAQSLDDHDTNSVEFDSFESEEETGRQFGGFSNNIEYPTHDTPTSACKCSCGVVNSDARIVGGKQTVPNRYPWMARLLFLGRFFCGGSLINDRYVLTAAHCVQGIFWFLIQVTLGEHDICSTKLQPESRYVLRVISQPFSYSNYDHDIALLRLNDRVPINQFIRPICLPDRRSSHYAGIKAIVTGWGLTEELGKTSCVLREVQVPIITNLDCVQGTNYISGMITENMICAGYADGEHDSCQGDSGGPLIVERSDKRFELAGIVSWGIGCGRAGFPGVYTRVSRHVNWIRQYTHDACYCKVHPTSAHAHNSTN